MRKEIGLALVASALLSASAALAQDEPTPAPPPVAPPPAPAPAPVLLPPPPPPGAPLPPPGPPPGPYPAPGTQPYPPPYQPYPPYPQQPPIQVPPAHTPPPDDPHYSPSMHGRMPPPRVIEWNEGEIIPPGYRKGTRIRMSLVISGSVLFGTAWLPSVITGSFFVGDNSRFCGGTFDPTTGQYVDNTNCGASPATLMIPIVGPWIAATSTEAKQGVLKFWLAFDGLQQTAGVALLIAGFAAPKTVLLRSDVRSAKSWWLPLPMAVDGRGLGLGVIGTM